MAALAHKGFDEIQAEMKPIAAEIAKQRKLPSSDYRDVIRELKKQQLVGDAILPFYQNRLKQIEDIIRKQNLVTLPDRPARIRIASAAETAQQPAPHMSAAAVPAQHRREGRVRFAAEHSRRRRASSRRRSMTTSRLTRPPGL